MISLISVKKFRALLVIVPVAALGAYLIVSSHAATVMPHAAIEAESGAITGGALVDSDPTASGGNYVKFGTSTNSGAGGTKLTVSVNNTAGWGSAANQPAALLKGIGVTWTRVDIGMGTDTNVLNTVISEGMHPFPILTGGTSDGNCNGVSPGTIGSTVTNLIPTLKADGLTTLEICNESYLTETDSAYAAQYNAAHQALAGSGIKALAVATALSTTCGAGDANPNWIPDVIHDLPGGASEVDGWTIHPYGPISGAESCSSSPNGYGWEDVPDWHTIAVNAGSSAPWYITEVGQCLGDLPGDSGCNTPISQATQAADMTQYLNDILTK